MIEGSGLVQFYNPVRLAGPILSIRVRCLITAPYFGKEEDEGEAPGVSFKYSNDRRSPRSFDDRGVCLREWWVNV